MRAKTAGIRRREERNSDNRPTAPAAQAVANTKPGSSGTGATLYENARHAAPRSLDIACHVAWPGTAEKKVEPRTITTGNNTQTANARAHQPERASHGLALPSMLWLPS